MFTAEKTRKPLPFNPAVLKWAREVWGLFDLEEAAKKVGTSPGRVEQWEEGTAVPTERQGRLLARFYKFPFIYFLMESIPDMKPVELVPDFRLDHPVDERDSKVEIRSLRRAQSWAESRRLNAIDLYEMIDETPRLVPKSLKAGLSDDPEACAGKARETSNFSLDDQFGLSGSGKYKLPKILRKRIESLGIIVLKISELTHSRARGLCFFSDPLPVIAYRPESPGSEAFTLSHELGHVLLGISAISDSILPKNAEGPIARVEKWCSRFAGAFLMPEAAVLERVIVRNMAENISDFELRAAAKEFGVSAHAMLVRLVQLRLVDPAYYWNCKRDEFLDEDAKHESFGGYSHHASRLRSRNGDLYTGLVLEAWGINEICAHNAGEFLETHDTAQLRKLRENFRV